MNDTTHSQFRTFVLRITDMDAARTTIDPLMGAFSGRAQLPGIEVTGASMEDEMTRAELLEFEELDLHPAPIIGLGTALATPGLADALQLADHASPMPVQAQGALQALRRALADCLQCSPAELLAVAEAHQRRGRTAAAGGQPPASDDPAPSMAP